ncbi:putative gustatory receptor 28a [Linepithema humile]|uniref:putative gustatory receptor 28a n=1 Tax=Linepithema humile TaxID=83485 RepID=UPI0006232792|nr:PREDICTED: putative gustatory receptor 28a [Linepithema humile]
MFRPSSKFQERAKSKVRKRWRLFHATDFQSLMLPCFIFCRILGLFPYKINGSNFETSRLRYILSSVIMGLFCAYGLSVLYEIDISGRIGFDGVPGSLQAHCYFLLGTFIAIVTYILSGARMRLLQTVMEISARLPPESYQKLSRIIHTKDIIGFSFLLSQIPNCRSYNMSDILYKMFAMYITLLVFQMDMLYMNCVCVLKACFQRINHNLMNLRELVVNDEPHLLRRIYHEQRNPFLLMELKALKKRHLMVSDTVQMLNVIFSLQLLATIVMTFAEVTFSLYFYIAQMREKIPLINLDKQIWYAYYITSITYYSIKMALIVWACETGKDQAVAIGTTVHDVLISTSDKQIKDELQLFSLQILHRENTFSAKGLNVDATLLTAIVGSITTYLLILIQFMVTAHICDGKSSNVTVT